MCAPISNASLERLFNHINIVKPNVRNALRNSVLNSLLRIKVANVPVNFFYENHVSSTVRYRLEKKAGKWRKENPNATNVESQTFPNDLILSFQPCRHPLHK